MGTVRSYHEENAEMYIEQVQILADGVEIEQTPTRRSLQSVSLSREMSVNFEFPIPGKKAEGIKITGKVSYTPEVKLSIDYGAFELRYFELDMTETQKVEATAVAECMPFEKEIFKYTLATVGLASADVTVKLVVELSGEVKLESEVVTKTSFVYSNGTERHNCTTEKKNCQVSASVNAEAGLKAALSFKVGFDGPGKINSYVTIAELSAKVAIEGNMTYTFTDAPGCADIELNLVVVSSIEVGIVEVNFFDMKTGKESEKKDKLSFKYDLYNVKILLKRLHWEGTIKEFTEKCLQTDTVTATFYYGVGKADNEYTQKVLTGEKLSEPPAVSNPGYELMGWYTNEKYSGKAWDFDKDVADEDIP